MAEYKIPLSAGPHRFRVQLGANTYQFVLVWRDAHGGGWFLDINDAAGNALVGSLPLVPGVDLLAQYEHLGIGGGLYVATDGAPLARPTFNSLGVSTWLYYVTSP
ncbi:phage baseplate plug family protein [Chromobacterium subtsugae]|uniref:phage baseplate plug family protein n=1 Tax=Chromobacterium subtsugae TaxID=251747 RepID=UPI0006415BDA|nr:hypothetical protein [Chromobacterium subtsugae]